MENKSNKQKGEHGIPALVSFFFPGVGQLMKGHWKTAILVWVALMLSFIACFFMVGLIMLPVVWIWNSYNAYTATEDNLGGIK